MNLLIGAGAFVLIGVALLLFNFGLFARYEPTAQYVVAGLLGVGGFSTLVSYFWRRDQWYRLMPGWTLLALAAMVLMSLERGWPRPYIAATLFVGLALAFANLYLVNRAEQWWAILPSGFMAVLAAVIALTATVTRLETLGAILFAGMGVVFGLLYLLAGKRRHWWALIPAGVLLLWRWWPSALIVVGALLAFLSTLRRTSPERLSINVAPTLRTGTPATKSPLAPPGQLGDYSQPAPGASVEILPDLDKR
jgi:hypothetical protein